jgi:UDP-N-acetylmuramate dehydrogenase
MMAASRTERGLIARLPPVRGRYSENAALSRVTWFGAGGPAEVMFRPADVADLAHFLAHKPADVPVFVLGVGSNLLVRDGGVEGVVVRLGQGFTDIVAEGAEVRAGAGALDGNVALIAADAGLEGLEFLSGIPGTVGGALRMNAGAYGVETKDVLVRAEAVDGHGRKLSLSAADLGHSYRHSTAPEDWIFTAAVFQGRPGDRAVAARRISEIQAQREATQPIRARTGGSIFKNPPGYKAWELIDKAGCRGLKRGDAMVSDKHCNFLINAGEATAADLEGLGEEVRRRVRENAGLELEWEIKRIGRPR